MKHTTHNTTLRAGSLSALFSSLALIALFASPASAESKETQCTDGLDNDNDSVIDCSDADCAKTPACKPDGRPENTNKRCRDWIDNDEDGVTDCEDQDCQTGVVTCLLYTSPSPRD